MFLARVKGHVVATAKDEGIRGHRLLLVEPLRIDYDTPETAGTAEGGGGRFEPTHRAIVTLDPLGVSEGQLVLICQGSSARQAQGMSKTPADAVVVGIVDKAVIMGQTAT